MSEKLTSISLKTKIAGTVLLLVFASLWALTFYLEKTLAQDMVQLLESQQFSAVSYIASDLDEKFRFRIDLLNTNARTITSELLSNPEKARAFLKSRLGLLSLFKAGLSIVSSDGIGIADYPPVFGRAHASFGEIEYFKEVIATGKTAIGKPRIGRFTKEPGVAIAAPIKDKSGQIIGMLVGFATFSDSTLFGQVEHAHVGKTGFILIDDPKHGMIATSSDPARRFQPIVKPGVNKMLDRFMAGFEGSGISINSHGIEVLSSAKWIPSIGWFAQIVLPTEEAFAPIRSMTYRAYSFAAVLSVSVLVVVWVVIWRLLAPLSQASNRLSEMSSGELQPIPIKYLDEVGRLLTNFNFLVVERKQDEAALRDSEDRFRNILENAPIGMSIVSLEGRFLQANRSLCKIVGYNNEELQELTFQEITYPEDLGPDLANLKLLLDGSINSYSIEKRYIRKDQQVVWVQLTASIIRDDTNAPVYCIAQIEDITNRKQWKNELEETNRKLETLSISDGLTGIANRRRFDEILAQEYARHARTRGELSLIMVDIDHFKLFNDHYGHVSGDECLRNVAKVLNDCAIRPADLAARYGGEEFACILPETDQRGALLVAERIRQGIIDLSIPHEWSDAANYVSASLGVVTTRCNVGDTVSDIIIKADEMLYRAKTLGRNRVEFNEIQPVPEPSNISLMQLVWQDSFCSGNQLIDMQHQMLFQNANELMKAIIELRPIDVLSSKVTHLLDDLTQHFHDEENILESIGYPDLKQHALEHERLYKDGLKLAQKLNDDTFSIGLVFEFLVNDLVNHILGTDREFLAYTNTALFGESQSED